MKLNHLALTLITASALVPVTAAATTGVTDFTPERVSYDYLTNMEIDSSGANTPTSNEVLLLDALSSEGLVSITDIPRDFAHLKKSVMSWLHSCIKDQGTNADHVLETIEKDGTIRRTFASKTMPGRNGQKDFMLKMNEEDELSPSCIKFSEHLDEFRTVVGQVTKVFAERLTTEMSSSIGSYDMPIMTTEDGSDSFKTIADIVASGEHLEHFHSYQKIEQEESKNGSLSSSSSSLRSNGASSMNEEETINLHTDQGFFIAFAPGLMVTHIDDNDYKNNKPDPNVPLWETEGFYIEKSDGSRAHVHFTADDDLVFMMGDGVNQYINPAIKNSRTLRATPHSVTLPAHSRNLSRAWFGRMVLPPANGISSNDGKSFGEIRNLLVSSESPIGSLGCSNIQQRALSAGGEGCHGAQCADICNVDDGNMFCWFRCMDLATHNADNCDAQGLPLKCINPREQVSDGFKHGDYYPACTNSTANITDYPKLDGYPQDTEICTNDEWETFSDSTGYDHSFDLSTDLTTAKFMWSVNADGHVEGRIAYNGLFGWLALGLLNLAPGAGHKGMNGASILMAVPGGEYSPKTGFDLTIPASIGEYEINLYGSAFRHWSDPITNSTSNVSSTVLNNDECFTSFSFVADGINSIPFNATGSDVLLWAANTEDAYAGYHKLNRARFEVNWASGDAALIVDPEDDDEHGGHNHESASSKMFVSTGIFAVVAVLTTIFI